jgi:lipopolysaccharide export system permease protein
MSALRFFPSRTLAYYVARLFLVRSFAILALLVVVLQTLDLLGESGKILSVAGNSDADVWRYVALRLPQIIARFLPFSVLLGTLLTLATLNQNSEVIAMKAGSMSAHQILAPLIVASLFVAGGSFLFNERIVTRSNAALAAWQKVDYARVPMDSAVRTNVWVRSGDDLMRADIVRRNTRPLQIEGVSLFVRRAGGIESIVRAPRGVWTPQGWRLSDATRFDAARDQLSQIATVTVAAEATPDRFTLANVKGDELPIAELRTAITELTAAGRSTGALETAYWHKISGPLSAVLMPLLGAVAAFGLARSGQLFLRAVIGMALGFAYFVVDNFGVAMGNLNAYPPLLAAWGPFFLFLLIGEAVLMRTEE